MPYLSRGGECVRNKKRASHTNMFANISHRKKEEEKKSLIHMFAHIVQPMSHPISPIISPTCITDILLCVSLAQPILPIYHAPFFLYVSRHLLFFKAHPHFPDVSLPIFPIYHRHHFFGRPSRERSGRGCSRAAIGCTRHARFGFGQREAPTAPYVGSRSCSGPCIARAPPALARGSARTRRHGSTKSPWRVLGTPARVGEGDAL